MHNINAAKKVRTPEMERQIQRALDFGDAEIQGTFADRLGQVIDVPADATDTQPPDRMRHWGACIAHFWGFWQKYHHHKTQPEHRTDDARLNNLISLDETYADMGRVAAGVDYVPGLVETVTSFRGRPPMPHEIPQVLPPIHRQSPQFIAYIEALTEIRQTYNPQKLPIDCLEVDAYRAAVEACTRAHFPKRARRREFDDAVSRLLQITNNRLHGMASGGGRQIVADKPVIDQLNYVLLLAQYLELLGMPSAPKAVVPDLVEVRDFALAAKATRLSPAQVTPPPAPPPPRPATRPGKPQDEVNLAVRDYLLKNPTATVRDIAQAVHCSTSSVSKSPAWKAVQEERAKGRQPKVRTVSLSKKMQKVAGQEDEALAKLLSEQNADAEPSPLEDDPDPRHPVKIYGKGNRR